MCDIIQVAEVADIIINGYAFTKVRNYIRVLNLNKPDKAAVINQLGEVLETSVGLLSEREVRIIREFIKVNYKEMYLKWAEKSDKGYYGDN